MIKQAEIDKRKEIIKNFENHFVDLKAQMEEDNKKLVDDDGVSQL